MSRLLPRSAGPCLVSVLVSLVADASLAASDQSVAASAPKVASPSPSAGLLNDWLREQSSAFQAWDIGGQVRGRYELFDNGGTAYPNRDFQREGVENDNSYLWTRERLHLGYKSSWFSIFSEGQNSDSTGDRDPRDLGQDGFDLHQAYVTLGNAKKFPLTTKVGRQEMGYGDERLIGASDWSNTGRVFDAAKLRFENDLLWVDAFAGRLVLTDDTTFDEADHHDWLFGVYASSRKLVPIQESQLYFLSRNAGVGAAVTPRDIYSVGARVKSLPGKLKGWDYFAEGVGQFGNITAGGVRREQQAFATAVGGGYTFKGTFASPRVGLEYDYGSGDSDPNDDKNEVIDNLFPTNHRHYGLMDFVGWRNIHDLRLSAGLKPHKQVSVSLDYHLFWLADTRDYFYPQGGSGRSGNGYGRNPGFDSSVGSELDLDVSYSVASWANLRAGYGHFFTGSYVDSSKRNVGGATDADWFYVQATVNF